MDYRALGESRNPTSKISFIPEGLADGHFKHHKSNESFLDLS